MTHAYFMFYHALANVVLRRVVRLTVAAPAPGAARAAGDTWTAATYAAYACAVLVLSYATAFMETLTIANFKYYTFVDKGKMYRCGRGAREGGAGRRGGRTRRAHAVAHTLPTPPRPPRLPAPDAPPRAGLPGPPRPPRPASARSSTPSTSS